MLSSDHIAGNSIGVTSSPLPTKADQQTLDISWRGLPFIRVEAKALGSGSLDIQWRGMPFFARGGSSIALRKFLGTAPQAFASDAPLRFDQ